MQAIQDLYRELTDLYAYQVETDSAIFLWANHLAKLATSGESTIENRVFFGRDDPNDRAAKYQLVRPFRDLIRDSKEGGRNIRLHRNGVVALAYALWEDEYRQKIAKELGLSKNDIESDVFHDLNKYRQAVLHVSGQLDREPKVLKFFSKGDVVSFTKVQMDQLFTSLITELNQIGQTYYQENLGLSLDKSFYQS